MKVAFRTLGCKVNQYDTEAMMNLFKSRGYEVVDFRDRADVYVINTCTVTGKGEAKSRQAIRQVTRENPNVIVVVAGCYPQAEPDEVVNIPGVSLVIGTRERWRIVDLVEEVRRTGQLLNAVDAYSQAEGFEELPIHEFHGRTRATVKIQEGCELYCSYCIVPYARGPMRSRKPENVMSEVRRLVAAGFKEIVLTGIHLGAYGREVDEGIDLAGIIQELSTIEGLDRIRLSSVEPTDVTPSLVDAIARIRKLCRHLHIPLQSGADSVLKRMNRRYTTTEYRRLMEELRQRIPGLAVTTDVMVGFPGETDEEYEQSFRFVEEMGFSRLHVFRYSRRSGTPAAEYEGQVPEAIKEERCSRLIGLGRRMAYAFNRQFLGEVLEVLVEQDGNEGDSLEGLTDNYIRVRFPGPEELKNMLVRVQLTEVSADGARGRLQMQG